MFWNQIDFITNFQEPDLQWQVDISIFHWLAVHTQVKISI